MGDNPFELKTGQDWIDKPVNYLNPMYWAGEAVYGAGNAIKGAMEGPEIVFPEQPVPEIPEQPKPEAPVEAGDEGIRKGSMLRESKKRALGQLYLTRGQQRADDMTLGGYRQTLA
jgi:hypothetical protein